MESDTARISSNSNQSRPKDNQSGTGRAAEQSPTDRLVNSNGNIEEISKALDDTALNLDPQTFKNLADNADAYYNKLAEAGITDVTGLKEAFAQGDVNYVKFVVSKQLAAERLVNDLMQETVALPETDILRFRELYDTAQHLCEYSDKLSSAYGRGLNAQKVTNKVRTFFNITSMDEENINTLAELLSYDLKSLDFTRVLKATV